MSEVSPWLSAISAFERRLQKDNLKLNEYRCLAIIHEKPELSEEMLINFISHNELEKIGKMVVDRLLTRELLERDEENNKLKLTEHAAMIIDEIYRLCQSRLTRPLFVAPNY